MCRPPRRVPVSRWALAAITALLSLLFAAPASADTVTPVRYCAHGDGYRELDGGSSVMVSAPEGYLIVSYCVDSRGRKGSSEVRTLSTPQRTTVVWHSDGRSLAGYSVEYARGGASGGPETDTDEQPKDAGDERDERDEARESEKPEKPEKPEKAAETAEAEAQQSAPAAVEKTPATKKDERRERTPSASATPSAAEPSRQASAEASEQYEGSSQMSRLSDGEELRITSLDEDDDEGLRSLVVAGGIIIIGLLAGMVALLVRLPGQR
ncbi:hypothetical protein [Nocardioides sp.]|uniref:hypothetical protein n=1 Tax=Nocardioides sp. TaxID=35761 RepID=UPI001984CE4D|nr:hypothetical protein [Nocardioides sp.]MBC7276343.1 hypothetical protein [Nocardioides sp.]